MTKILILRVNGSIGHHLSTRILNSTDWRVFGMDMNSDRIAPLRENPRFQFFEGAACDDAGGPCGGSSTPIAARSRTPAGCWSRSRGHERIAWYYIDAKSRAAGTESRR